MSPDSTQSHFEGYIASAEVLGFDFSYPPEYIDSIAWEEADFDARGYRGEMGTDHVSTLPKRNVSDAIKMIRNVV